MLIGRPRVPPSLLNYSAVARKVTKAASNVAGRYYEVSVKRLSPRVVKRARSLIVKRPKRIMLL
jgi:hypothetical protein